MTDIGHIKMRTPGGKPSVITVSTNDKGVGIHLTRSAEGEALILLPQYAAKELADLLAKATATGAVT